jgi:hypothetical protein
MMRLRISYSLVLVLWGSASVGAQEHGAPAAHEPAPGKKAGTPAGAPVHERDGHSSAAARKPAAKPEHNGAAPEASATARHASSKELDAVLARISKRIAARSSSGAAKPDAKRAAPAAAVPGQPAHSEHPRADRIELEWRPSVTWPGDLKPELPTAGEGRVGVAWPSSVE